MNQIAIKVQNATIPDWDECPVCHTKFFPGDMVIYCLDKHRTQANVNLYNRLSYPHFRHRQTRVTVTTVVSSLCFTLMRLIVLATLRAFPSLLRKPLPATARPELPGSRSVP